jgi:hypothetical protein
MFKMILLVYRLCCPASGGWDASGRGPGGTKRLRRLVTAGTVPVVWRGPWVESRARPFLEGSYLGTLRFCRVGLVWLFLFGLFSRIRMLFVRRTWREWSWDVSSRIPASSGP